VCSGGQRYSDPKFIVSANRSANAKPKYHVQSQLAGARAFTDKHNTIAKDVDSCFHLVMRTRKVLERKNLTHARIDNSFVEQTIVGPRLVIIGPVRALQSLLEHPKVAQVDHCRVTSGASAYHHHVPGITDEHARGDGCLAGMLDHHLRISPFANDLPDLLTEGASSGRPRTLALGVVPMWWDSPVVEFSPVDVADGAQFLAVLTPGVVRHHSYRNPSGVLNQLNGLGPDATRPTP
jgi:hypothetical protein